MSSGGWFTELVDGVKERDQLHRFTLRRDVHEVGDVAEINRRTLNTDIGRLLLHEITSQF